jgi:hypothetical protein
MSRDFLEPKFPPVISSWMVHSFFLFSNILPTVRSLSVSFFIEKEPHKQLRMKRKRKGERYEKETPPAHGNRQ